MHGERIAHTQTVLRDGHVLVVGGLGKKLQGLPTAEVYDPAHNTWTSVAPMRLPVFPNQPRCCRMTVF